MIAMIAMITMIMMIIGDWKKFNHEESKRTKKEL